MKDTNHFWIIHPSEECGNFAGNIIQVLNTENLHVNIVLGPVKVQSE